MWQLHSKRLFRLLIKPCKMYYYKKCFLSLMASLLWLNALYYIPAAAVDVAFTASPLEQKEKSAKLPPCKSCTVLVDSFKVGLAKTSRGKHAGGDAAWEEEKLRSYKTSEVRLVEIQEHLCVDVKRGQDQCHNMANDYENLLEEWFLHKQNEQPDLHNWLCVEQIKTCCTDGFYGPDCKPCTDCHGNGKCKGSGTRKGNGKCACDAGYSGDNCSECADTHYESFRDENKLLCSACYTACGDGGCTGAGPKACRKCKEGWRMDSERGCMDVNECVDKKRVCLPQQFCVNNEGSHSCLECDRSCEGCDGDGPDMCKKCASGYKLKDGKCQDEASEQRDSYINFARFLTYFGLCLATCVIFQSSTHIAVIVGAAVAMYIAASEYWLSTSPTGTSPRFDAAQLEEMLMKAL